MLRDERLDSILRMLNVKGFATVPQLCAQFGVSPATVRRDLEELSERRLVHRNRNGAVPYQEHHTEASVHFRAAVNAKAKEKIARAASELVEDGSLIFIDSSTTVLSMVSFLNERKNLTIVSNSLMLMTLMKNTCHRLILTGGEYYAPSHAFYGSLAVEGIEAYNFDYAFISSVAVTEEGWAAETLEHSVSVRQAAFGHARRSVLMCDKSKMNLHRPYNIIHIDSLDQIITDDPVYPVNTATPVIRV
ncbi:MAG: DeoR/GlpR transcriptional regulator [Clostridia bacterium]|nr:DeoR/GlpR transcriptional regulator [Clostridia bacterium]